MGYFRKSSAFLALVLAGIGLGLPRLGMAGVFNLPHFVVPSEFAVGLEPDFLLSNGTGMGVNLRYTQGISETNNLSVMLGTGTNTRLFRAGGAFTFDFFPDIEGQPGIGLALQGLYVQLPNTGSVEVTGIPYIHKSLSTDKGSGFEPFLAIPVGISLSNGTYQPLTSLALGCLFQHSEHFRSVVELGIPLNNTQTYISGGIVYYH